MIAPRNRRALRRLRFRIKMIRERRASVVRAFVAIVASVRDAFQLAGLNVRYLPGRLWRKNIVEAEKDFRRRYRAAASKREEAYATMTKSEFARYQGKLISEIRDAVWRDKGPTGVFWYACRNLSIWMDSFPGAAAKIWSFIRTRKLVALVSLGGLTFLGVSFYTFYDFEISDALVKQQPKRPIVLKAETKRPSQQDDDTAEIRLSVLFPKDGVPRIWRKGVSDRLYLGFDGAIDRSWTEDVRGLLCKFDMIVVVGAASSDGPDERNQLLSRALAIEGLNASSLACALEPRHRIVLISLRQPVASRSDGSQRRFAVLGGVISENAKQPSDSKILDQIKKPWARPEGFDVVPNVAAYRFAEFCFLDSLSSACGEESWKRLNR